jgi:2-polyprenyl-3-methyl-5-hydroxy-6-metoxy-1,4-benzoquinol methylase
MPGGYLKVDPLPNFRYRVTAVPESPQVFIARKSCETDFSLDLIQAVVAESTIGWICDDIARHCEPDYVSHALKHQLDAFRPPGEMRGEILDFGCGCGASTIFMARMFPHAQVTGVELRENAVELATRIAQGTGVTNARFLLSPSGESLPAGIGPFDGIMLSAVYEHLLPSERLTLLPLLWSALKPGGILYINQTPHRWSPLEHHTTGLWFINYLPDGLARYLANNYAREAPEENRQRDWEQLLRAGIRGGTEPEILSNIRQTPGARPVVLQPRQGDRAAHWLAATNPGRMRTAKKAIAGLFRMTDRLFGVVPATQVEMAIRKDA